MLKPHSSAQMSVIRDISIIRSPYTYIHTHTHIHVCIYLYSKLEITPNTTPEYLDNRLFIVNYGEQDLLVSAFDCLHQDIYIYIYGSSFWLN